VGSCVKATTQGEGREGGGGDDSRRAAPHCSRIACPP